MAGNREQSGAGGDGGPAGPPAPSRPVRGKRRRWVRVLLIVLGALVLLVGSAPYLAGGAARKIVLSYVNSRIRGQVDLENLSLSWFGPTVLTGLHVTDPGQGEVLEVGRIRLSKGIWQMVRGWEDLGRVEVGPARMVVAVDRSGGLGVANAFRPRRPRQEGEPARPLPRLTGTVALDGTAVELVRADGRRQEVHVEGTLDVGAMEQIHGDLRVSLPDGGEVRVKTVLHGLVVDGELREPTGQVEVKTASEVDLGPLAEFALGRTDVAGKGKVSAEAVIEAGSIGAKFDADVTALRAPLPGSVEVRPIDLHLAGNLSRSDERIEAKADLTGQAGRLHAELVHRPSRESRLPTAGEVFSAALAGGSLDWPDFEFRTSGEVDVKALGQAVPGLMNLRQGVEITGGRARVEDVEVRGGREPSGKGLLTLTDLTARRAEELLRWEPVVLEFDLLLEAEGGLRVRRAGVQSDFGHFRARGDWEALDVDFAVSLGRLHDQLAGVFDLGPDRIGGDVSGKIEIKSVAQDRLSLDVSADGRSLEYRNASGKHMIGSAVHVEQGVEVVLVGRTVGQVILRQARANVDNVTKASASGGVDLKTGMFRGDFTLVGVDLTAAAAWADLAGRKLPPLPQGKLSLAGAFSRASGQAPIIASGQVTIEEPVLDGEVLAPEATVVLRDLRYDMRQEALTVAAAGIESAPLRLAVNDFAGRLGDEPSVAGRLDVVRADLARCLRIARRITGREDLPQADGIASLEATVRDDGGRVVFEFAGKVDDASRAASTLGDSLLALKGDGWFDPKARTFHAQVDAERADLAYLAGRFRRPTGGGRAGARTRVASSGTLELHAGVDRPQAGGPMEFSGKGVLVARASDAEIKQAFDFRVSGAEVRQAGGGIDVALVEFRSEPANLTGRDVRYRSGVVASLDGRVELQADLGQSLGIARTLPGWERAPDLSGPLAWDVRFQTDGDVVQFRGDGTVRPLRVGGGKKGLVERRVDFSVLAQADRRRETLTLEKAAVRSESLLASVSGTVRDWSGERVLDFSGDWLGPGEALTALAVELCPELKDRIALAGRAGGRFSLAGPARGAGLKPPFRGLAGTAEASWGSASVLEVPLGPAQFRPTLADAVARLPRTPIASGAGRVNLQARVDLSGSEPTLSVPGERGPQTVVLLEDVPVSRRLGEDLLSRFVVVLSGARQVTGRVSLEILEDIALPLGAGLRTGGSGAGRVTLKDLKVASEEKTLLSEMLRIAGLRAADALPVEVGGLDFRIKGGRVWYDNCRVVLGGVLDLKFYGSVGFDDTLDLTVSVPMRTALLEDLGVSGPVADYARVLEGVRLEVPVRGTRGRARVDFSGANVGALIAQAGRVLLTEEAARAIRQAVEPKAPSTRASPPRPWDLPKTTEQMLLDGVLDLLRDRLAPQKAR